MSSVDETPHRVALVTGASSGIGEATARLLAGRGWRCVLVARREQQLQALAAEIGGEAEPCDIGDRAAVDRMAARVLDRHAALHLLVSNAGMPARRTLVEAEPDLVERVLAVNYLGGVWTTRALMPGLRAAAAAGRADVVDVVSVAGTVAFAASGAYCASKHAQLAWSRSLREALRGTGIHGHTVLPGFVATEGFPQTALLARRRLRRLVARPERVAEAILGAVERDRAEVVVPRFPYRLAPVLQGVAPGLVARLAAVEVGPGGVGRTRAERT